MDVAWLCEYVLELAWKEAEDKWTESDGVGDEWKEGGKGEKEKRDEKGRRRGHTMTTTLSNGSSVCSSSSSDLEESESGVISAIVA